MKTAEAKSNTQTNASGTPRKYVGNSIFVRIALHEISLSCQNRQAAKNRRPRYVRNAIGPWNARPGLPCGRQFDDHLLRPHSARWTGNPGSRRDSWYATPKIPTMPTTTERKDDLRREALPELTRFRGGLEHFLEPQNVTNIQPKILTRHPEVGSCWLAGRKVHRSDGGA